MVLKMKFDKEFENRFRELAMRRYGYSKGSIKKASEDAFKKWMKEFDKPLPKVKDPIKSIRGMMQNLRGKYTSVELQHEAVKTWAKKK